MLRFQRLKAGMTLIYIPLIIFAITTSLICGASVLLTIIILLWLSLLMYSINDLHNNIATFCFAISLFVFLIGREVCFEYLHLEVYYKYLTKENNFAFLCLIISILGLMVGKSFYTTRGREYLASSSDNYWALRRVTKIMFYFCYIFQTIAVLIQILFVRSVGYIESYSEEAGGAGVPAIISYIGAFMPIAFCLFIATKPTKTMVRLPIALYEIYAVLTVFSGKRYPFVAINMLILVYLFLRNKDEKGWISKKLIACGVIAVPLLILFLTAYDSIRTGKNYTFTGIGDTIINFLDSQGGSINVIKRVAYYADDLSNLKFCSFDSTRSLLFENMIFRKIFGIKVYSGNSVEHALYGHSLAHCLSYYSYGNGYLYGRGVGSCYIAELYHDFGYIGVFIGSFVYGRILNSIDNLVFSHPARDGILLAILYYILLAPRGGFDGFVGNVFGLYSLMGYAVIFVAVRFLKSRNTRFIDNSTRISEYKEV